MSGAERGRFAPAADGGEYRVVARREPLGPGELEGVELAIEVLISWGDGYLLQVAHVSAARGFVLGDGPAADGGKPDFVVDPELLGGARLPLVLDWNGQPAFTIPRGAQGWLELAGERIPFAELAAQALLHPAPGCGDARQTALPRAALARIQLGQLSISLRCVTAAERVGLDDRLAPGLRDQRWTLISAVLHVALLLGLYGWYG